MKNDTLKEIAEKLKSAESIALFPHVNPDGDALGSCAALCRALRKMGKRAFVVLDEEIPADLRFLDKGYCVRPEEAEAAFAAEASKTAAAGATATGFIPDVCMCVDCSTPDRLEKRLELFRQGAFSICIDHHMTEKPFCRMNFIDPGEAATGQIVFDLLKELKAAPDKETGEAIFAAITSDTGDFQYSNTQKKSHLIAAELFDWGIDHAAVSVELYENVSAEKMALRNLAMGTLKLIGSGRGAFVCVTQEMLAKSGASMNEADGLSQELRSLAGVEYAAVLKEYEPQKIKVSLRAKSRGDVASIAEVFGGGGHVKAAGCTIERPLKEAAALIEKEMQAAIERL